MINICYNYGCRWHDTDSTDNCGNKLFSNPAQCTRWMETPVGIEADPKKRGHILQKAYEIINGERQDTYGSPEDSFKLIAEYWNVYLIRLQEKILKEHGFSIDDYSLVNMLEAKEVAEMMMLFKIARMSGQKFSEDSYTDCAGYTALAADFGRESNGK